MWCFGAKSLYGRRNQRRLRPRQKSAWRSKLDFSIPAILIVKGQPSDQPIPRGPGKTAFGVTKSADQTASSVNKGEQFPVLEPRDWVDETNKLRVISYLCEVATRTELASEVHNKQAQKRIPVSMPRPFSLD